MSAATRRAITLVVTAAGTVAVLASPAAAADPWTTTDQRAATIAPSPTGTPPPLTPGNRLVRPGGQLDPIAVRAAVALAAARATQPATGRAMPSVAPRTRTAVLAPHSAVRRAWRLIPRRTHAPREQTRWPVQRGQTLGGIAFATGTTVQGIAALNGLDDPNQILAGSVLRIPARRG